MSLSSRADFIPSVVELHAACRRWTSHIPQNLPYVDLMFAFSFATLGDKAGARQLVEEARKVMVVPIPEESSVRPTDDPRARDIVSNFAFKAFEYRVDEALASKLHAGPLSAELLHELAATYRQAGWGRIGTSNLSACYAFDQMRVLSRVLEPHERVDPYGWWSKDEEKELFELSHVYDSDVLKKRIRPLLLAAWPLNPGSLRRVLSLALSTDSGFAREVLSFVTAALEEYRGRRVSQRHEDFLWAHALENAFLVCDYFGIHDFGKELLTGLRDLLCSIAPDRQPGLISLAVGQAVLNLKRLGLLAELTAFLEAIQPATLAWNTSLMPRERGADQLELRAKILRARAILSAGWLAVGQSDRAENDLEETRCELLSPHAPKHRPVDYSALANAYAFALGELSDGTAVSRMSEFFREMHRTRLTNTWVTAPFYSRFHLAIIDATVLAICRSRRRKAA